MFSMSVRQAYRTLSLSRTVYFYQPDTRRDEPVIQALTEYNSERPHEPPNNLTPEEDRLMAEKPEISKSVWN
ncbi:transposase [Rahnella aquatilis CIP 78.65 = ATCC 33071]|nr:transposase [Rahnella aquatilis CIP 78.65 = ATCC 33071]